MNPLTRAWRKLAGPNPRPPAQVADLKGSCFRMLTAADSERQRLEHDLHHGVQQRLVSLSLTVSMAQKRAQAGDAAGAEQMLAQAGEESRLALDELRDLARGLHPAILTNRGLRPALEDLADRTEVRVEVRVGVEDRLAPAVEATAYFVVSEALANVGQHADAHAVTVDARIERGELVVEVADDGRGGAEIGAGTALAGLVDRLGALGGTLALDSAPGRGTRLVVRMPALAAADAPETTLREPAAEPRRGFRRRLSGPGPRPAPR